MTRPDGPSRWAVDGSRRSTPPRRGVAGRRRRTLSAPEVGTTGSPAIGPAGVGGQGPTTGRELGPNRVWKVGRRLAQAPEPLRLASPRWPQVLARPLMVAPPA